ncbi:MAG: hypothetical protein NZM11_02800 [Anaerolineales bacterium]|nr:hypothetical protein [Anaerolineales bacterium]
MSSIVSAAGARPEPFRAVTRYVHASQYSANTSPPMPVGIGSMTLRAAAMGTAASAALSSYFRMDRFGLSSQRLARGHHPAAREDR